MTLSKIIDIAISQTESEIERVKALLDLYDYEEKDIDLRVSIREELGRYASFKAYLERLLK